MRCTRWIIDRPKYGSHVVRDRESREVIGGIIPFRKAGRDVQYMATRVDGKVRDFAMRFDAAAWLMDAFDVAAQESCVSLKEVK
jgi:hypothetical protein